MFADDTAPPPLPAPPAPKSAAEAARVEHTRLRRRVMYSMHHPDVESRLVKAIGTTRAKAVRIVDMTANPAWYVTSQLAGLYRDIPEINPPAGGEDTAEAVLEAGFWQLAQRNQRDCIGLNDMFVRVDLDDNGAPAFRLVFPDLVSVVSSPLSPAQPLALAEWIEDPDDPTKWVQLVCDPRKRLYVARDDRGFDVTARVLGKDGHEDFSGENYPFLVQGKPVLPYVAYHAAETGYALDPYTGREVFEGALQLGVYYSFFGHALRQASWAQRWAAGAAPDQGDVEEDGRRKEAVADPATLVILKAIEDAVGQNSIQVGQWGAPVDPDRFFAAIERYERRLVEMALSTVGVSRRESDVRSAMSLAVSREAQRDAQRAYAPVFRRSDIRLLRLVSGLRGGPVDGWRIEYKSLPRDPAELAAELARMEGLLKLGLIDKVSAYRQLHPGLDDREALEALKKIEAVNAQFEPAEPTPAAGPGAGAPTAPEPSQPSIALTSTDIASIVTVDEARAAQGLAPIGGEDGKLTVSEYQAKHAAVVAKAANAAAGQAPTAPENPSAGGSTEG
jgi:hypothetical protein